METTWFTLGVLAMIMVMLIAVVIVGMVKVFRMHKQVREFYSHVTEIERHWFDRLNDTHRDINMIEGTMRNSMDQYDRVVNDQITDAVTQAKSHTDSRIDKLVDTYFAVKEAEENSKKLLK